jgi:DNA-binding SARP family transcriptional activator
VLVEFAVLGPLRVYVGAQTVDIGGQRQRRILAMLLLNVGRTVGVADLVAAAWDDDPPPTARRQVQTAVWQLRREFARHGAGDALETGPAGYRLAVDPQQVDLFRFEAMLAEGTRLAARGASSDAARHLRAAVALWSGPTLGGVGGAPVEQAAARIDRLRLTALEEWADCELAAGDRPGLLAELTTLTGEHPLSERLASAYMLALYRADRQAEALQAYRRVVVALADELGVDPGPRLTDTYAAILRRDPALDHRPAATDPPPAEHPAQYPAQRPAAAEPRPAQLPAGTASFVGRHGFLRDLDALLPVPDESAPATVVTIDGTAGVGKTALVLHWAHRVRQRFPDGQLYIDLRGFDATAPPVPANAAIRAFLDAFAVPPGRIPAGLDPQAALYRTILADRRVLVVLDNARDVAQVRPLLPAAPGCMAVVTSRNRLTGLVAREGAHPVSLDPFTADQARQLLERRVGADRMRTAGPGAVDEIITRCAGLPLALAIVAARAVIRPRLPLDALADEMRGARLDAFGDDDGSTDVRAVLSWSYRLLREPAARLFRLLALHPGPDLTAAAAASLAGLTPAETGPLLSDLCDAHLLAEHPNGRFSQHDLLRAYATELVHDLDEDRDLAVRRVTDHYLQTAASASRLKYPLQQLGTPDPPLPDVTPEPLTTDGEALAWFVAEQQVLLATVRLAADAGLYAHTWQLANALMSFLNVSGRVWELAAVQEVALDAVRHLDDRAAQAMVHRMLGHAYLRLDRRDDAELLFRQAFDLYKSVGDRQGQARILDYLSQVADRQDRHDEALHHARQALDIYRDIDDKLGQGSTLNMIGWTLVRTGDHRRALALCDEALRAFREMDDPYGQMAVLDTLGFAHHHLGEHDLAVSYYRQAADWAVKLGNHHNHANALLHLADTYQASGDPGAARAAREQALAIFTELGHPGADAVRAALRETAGA